MTQFTPRSGEGGWGAARADPTLSWTMQREVGVPARLAALDVPWEHRLIRWCEPTGRGIVTGSGVAFPTASRRISGGTAVLVGPDLLVWADVVVPAADPLWVADVGVAPLWLGRVWAGALEALGVAQPAVHEGSFIRSPTPWCFAGTGPGEVLVAGRKVVGISQRRTRSGVMFQCAALLRWEPAEPELADVAIGLVDLLARPVEPAEVEAAFWSTVRAL